MKIKYIDTEKLIAEIERLQKSNSIIANHAANSNMRNFYDGEVDCCKQLLSFINSLQQEQPEPEVNLDADIKMEWDSFNKHVAESEDVVWMNWLFFVYIARHFYELGLNTKKERTNLQ